MKLIFVLFLIYSTQSSAVNPILSDISNFIEDEELDYQNAELLLQSTAERKVQLEFVYHNYVQMTEFLQNVTKAYPSLTHLYSIGKSVKGRDLWVLAVSTTPEKHVLGKPELKYVGNIHGNEPIGREILLHLILYLVEGYGQDQVATVLLERSRIHFLPSMNPDGFEVAREGQCHGQRGRRNARDQDLNRNFPDYFQRNSAPLQPETEALMNWMDSVPFVLSAGLHGGALVASYPYENQPNYPLHIYGHRESPSPDDDVFKHLATVYAKNHAEMWQGKPCTPKAQGFANGITNGAAWYSITGGMQDYNYIYHGTMEITIEVSCCKYPPASQLQQHWEDNEKALLAYLLESQRGIKGFVRDEEERPLSNLQLRIKGRERNFTTTNHGEFWRVLLPGKYVLQVSGNGFQPQELEVTVDGDEATVLNITLERDVVRTTPSSDSTTFFSGDGGMFNTTPASNVSDSLVLTDGEWLVTETNSSDDTLTFSLLNLLLENPETLESRLDVGNLISVPSHANPNKLIYPVLVMNLLVFCAVFYL